MATYAFESLHHLVDTATDLEGKIRSLSEQSFSNFDAWVSLIADVETTSFNDIRKISLVYDAFLSEYPLCYGYWKRYADYKARLGSINETVEVYERAVELATYSVGMWVSYCHFAMLSFEDPADIRRLFERALSFVGKDYLCHLLWDKYLEFEYSQKQWNHVAYIYVRVLKFPTKKIDSYYQSFKKLIAILEDEMRAEVCSSGESLPEVVLDADSNEDRAYTEPEIVCVIQDMLKQPAGTSLQNALKKYLSYGENLYVRTSKLNTKISCFEGCIRRPYFHVKLLDHEQLQNWHHYLDFVERRGDLDWVIKIYERCLIPCANYAEFWIRYVENMEANGGRELALYALGRATQVFLKKLPGIHLFCARFKERIRDIDGARAHFLQCSLDSASDFVENVRRRANMEKRLGNFEIASSIYNSAIAVAKEKYSLHTVSTLYTYFFQFTYVVTGDADAARNILVRDIHHLCGSKILLEELIRFETLHKGQRRIDLVDSVIAQATDPGPSPCAGLSLDDQEHISYLYLELVDLCGTSDEFKRAWDRHRRLFRHLMRSTATYWKHTLENNTCGKAQVGESGGINHLRQLSEHHDCDNLNQQATTGECQHAETGIISLAKTIETPKKSSDKMTPAFVDKEKISLPPVDQNTFAPKLTYKHASDTETPTSCELVTTRNQKQQDSEVINPAMGTRTYDPQNDYHPGGVVWQQGMVKNSIFPDSGTCGGSWHEKNYTRNQGIQEHFQRAVYLENVWPFCPQPGYPIVEMLMCKGPGSPYHSGTLQHPWLQQVNQIQNQSTSFAQMYVSGNTLGPASSMPSFSPDVIQYIPGFRGNQSHLHWYPFQSYELYGQMSNFQGYTSQTWHYCHQQVQKQHVLVQQPEQLRHELQLEAHMDSSQKSSCDEEQLQHEPRSEAAATSSAMYS